MLKVKIITVGRNKETWLTEALAEYKKRLIGNMDVEWIFVRDDPTLIEKINKEPLLIALDLRGKLISSVELSRKLFTEWGSRIAFVIGGADGLPLEVVQRTSFRWSLSPLTFTHQIVRLLLIEQLYRAVEIERGSSYHK
jgi:23S rRNA (pseudouridine1915-N3)-methyltransferase